MKLSDFYKTLEESFRHYTVKHKRSGKIYKVTAMHQNSALEKARAQHGGTASRYTGTGTSDFEVVEGIKDNIKTIAKGLKGPGYYSLDKDNPDHPADISDKLRKKLSQKEGKSPHKKGTKKYKDHMAAMHAEAKDDISIRDQIKKFDKSGKKLSDFIKSLKGPGYYSLDKDNPDHPADVSDKFKKKVLGKTETDEASIGAPDYNPARGDYADNMIGEPDDYYDAEERQEAYDNMQDDLDKFDKDDQESIMQGICPGCGGNGFMDGEEEMYNDETEEYEEGSECDGVGIFGCDEGELTGADWLDIVKHDERKADRQKSKDEYPGDEEVIKQVASYMKQMDDPRQAYQQMQADFPHMGRGQRSEILGKASKMAFGEAMAMPSVENTPEENTVCTILGKALNKEQEEALEYSPQELYSELESINPELADTIAKLSKVVYDVRLEERVYKDQGVADVQKDARGKEFKFDKDSKLFKSPDGEEADPKTKVGKELMRKRKNFMKRSTPSYNKKREKAPKKAGFLANLFANDEHQG